MLISLSPLFSRSGSEFESGEGLFREGILADGAEESWAHSLALEVLERSRLGDANVVLARLVNCRVKASLALTRERLASGAFLMQKAL